MKFTLDVQVICCYTPYVRIRRSEQPVTDDVRVHNVSAYQRRNTKACRTHDARDSDLRRLMYDAKFRNLITCNVERNESHKEVKMQLKLRLVYMACVV